MNFFGIPSQFKTTTKTEEIMPTNLIKELSSIWKKFRTKEFEDYPNNPKCPKFMIIKIDGRSTDSSAGDYYEAVRTGWRIMPKRANKYPFVLAVKDEIVVGVYRVHKWRKTPDSNSAYFKGDPAKKKIEDYFIHKRIPKKYRECPNPVSYCTPKRDFKGQFRASLREQNQKNASKII